MYIVIEIQTNADDTVGTIVNSYADYYQASSAYHTALAGAAISSLPTHSCALLTEEGDVVEHKFYKHGNAE